MMRITQVEEERLLIFGIAEVARRRWKRGVKLNYVEVSAIVCDELLERAREGKMTVAEISEYGSQIISREEVIEGTEVLLPYIMFEVLMTDGNKLITVHNPLRLEKKEDTVKDLLSCEIYNGGCTK